MIATSNTLDEFRQAITAAGLEAPDVIHDDGAIHRFNPSGRGSDKPAWYMLHMDGKRPAIDLVRQVGPRHDPGRAGRQSAARQGHEGTARS